MLVELNSLNKAFGERKLFNDVDFQIAEGERLSIVGPSGSGKSTFLNILGLLDDPDSGDYAFQGRQVAGLTEVDKASIRSRDIGFVFQLHHLLPQLSVFENATLPAYALNPKPDWEEVEKRAHSLLEKVGLQAHANKLPGQLSGGERQRVAVVRALINRPKLLLADEPTGALDRTNAKTLSDLLIQMNESEHFSLVVVTHDESLARKVGPVWNIDKGKVEKVI